MKLIIRAFLRSGMTTVLSTIAVLVLWGSYTIYISFRNLTIDLSYFVESGFFSLLFGAAQISILGSVWYRIGDTKARIRTYQFDANRHFNKVYRQTESLSEKHEKLRAEIETLKAKTLVFEKYVLQDRKK